MPAKVTLAGERVGIFAMDGGRTTGIAACACTLKGSAKEIFDRDPLQVFEVNCNDQTVHPTRAEIEGCEEIAEQYLQFQSEWTIEGIPTSNQFFIFEDFVLNRTPGSWDRSGISPCRVNGLVMGMLVNHRYIQWVPQMASEAKGRWTNERLRRSNLWTVGLEHGRDATRHAALWVVKELS